VNAKQRRRPARCLGAYINRLAECGLTTQDMDELIVKRPRRKRQAACR